MFDLLSIGLCGFSICGASDLMTDKEFEKLEPVCFCVSKALLTKFEIF